MENKVDESQQLADSLWKAVSNEDEQQVKLLLEKGADPDHKIFFENESSKLRETPLGRACIKSNLPIVKLLVQNGANPDRHSLMCFREAPLHLACRLKNNLDIVKYLVGEARCNVGIKDYHKQTPACYCVMYGNTEILKYLHKEGNCPLDYVESVSWKSLLHLASERNDKETVEYLVKEGHCDIYAKDKKGQTALDLAAKKSWTNYDVVNYLTELEGPEYIAKVYLLQRTWRIYVTITRKIFVKDVDKAFIEDMNTTEVSSMGIKFEQDEIQMEVSDVESFTDPESVVKSHFTEIHKSQVNCHRPGLNNIAECILSVSIPSDVNNTRSPRVSFKLLFNGAKKPNDCLVIRIPNNHVIEELQQYLKNFKSLLTNPNTVDIRCLNVVFIGPLKVGKTSTLNNMLETSRLGKPKEKKCSHFITFDEDTEANWFFSGGTSTEARNHANYLYGSCKDKLQNISGNLSIVPVETTQASDLDARILYQPNPQRDLLDQLIYIPQLPESFRSASNQTPTGTTWVNTVEIASLPGYLEILPSLTAGPTVYLVFFDLNQSQNQSSNSKWIENAISPIISAIASTKYYSNESNLHPKATDINDKVERFQLVAPVVLLIGTQRDKLSVEESTVVIKEVDKTVEKIKPDHGEIAASISGTSCHLVDNCNLNSNSDFVRVRKSLQRVFHNNFEEASLPFYAKWVYFGTLLQKENEIATMEDCLELGMEMSMDKIEVKACLRYLDRIGILLNYGDIADNKDKWFQSHVICSTQVMLNSIGKLLNLQKDEEIGKISNYHLKQYSAKVSGKLQLIPANQLVQLLIHLKILSPISQSASESMYEYLMPAFLQCATTDELTYQPPPDPNNPDPVFITFTCGYVPSGTFSSLITHLVRHGPHKILGLEWNVIVSNSIKRNNISFWIANNSSRVTLLCHEKCYEIRVSRIRAVHSLHDICSYVLTTVLYCMNSKVSYLLAFKCSCSDHLSSIENVCVWQNGEFVCGEKSLSLRPSQEIWFGKRAALRTFPRLQALSFCDDLTDFTFLWSPVADRLHYDTSNSLNELHIRELSEEEYGYYQCKVKKAGRVVVTVYKAFYKLSENASFIAEQPKDIHTKPGVNIQFGIKTSSSTIDTYQWYFDDNKISDNDADYMESTTDCLTLKKCYPKHKGFYYCVVTDESGKLESSDKAALTVDGEQMGKKESVWLGKILKNAGINFSDKGVSNEKLLEGSSDLTYEEVQFVLRENPKTHILSENLKEELQLRLKEELLYQAAISESRCVSLSYVKILALGPGQVGKSTFLYRLVGQMKGNIDTAPRETQPRCSTGQAELKEGCIIRYTDIIGKITADKNWEISDINSQIECLMSLLSEQTQAKKTKEYLSNKESISNSIPTVANLSIETANLSMETPAPVVSTRETENKLQDVGVQHSVLSVKQSLANTSSIPAQTSSSDYEYRFAENQKGVPNVDETIEEYKKLRHLKSIEARSSVTKVDMLFNIADVGGQPAYLDMLPSLIAGPALYLLFFKLVNDSDQVLDMEEFKTEQCVQFRNESDQDPQDCQEYVYSLLNVLISTLSSIACFGLSDIEIEKYVSKDSESQKSSSLALLLGTFADKININNRQKLVETEKELYACLKDTGIDNLIDFPDCCQHDGPVFFRVNNKTGSEDEITQYQTLFQELIEKKFRKYDIPAVWLSFSIHLKLFARKKDTYKIPFDCCVQLGKGLKMNETMVRVALKFLHKYVGLVLYFPNIENLVICNPQAVFSSVSALIKNVYDSASHNGKILLEASEQQKRFNDTGIFSVETVDYPKESQEMLSISDLVELLVHVNIAAEIPSSFVGSQEFSDEPYLGQDKTNKDIHSLLTITSEPSLYSKKEEYFLPAVLRTFDFSYFKLEPRGQNDEMLPEPLCIGFGAKYIPTGFTCALIAKLIAEKKFDLVRDNSILYKNNLMFRFLGQFNITLRTFLNHCEFHVTRRSGKIEFYEQDCCPRIIEIICKAADSVLKALQNTFLSEKSYYLAFKCPYCQLKNDKKVSGHNIKPLAKLVYACDSRTQLKQIKCSKCITTETQLKPEYEMWFGKIPNVPLEIVKQPTLIADRTIEVSARGITPLKYQWLLGETDGDNFGDIPTNSEHFKDSSTDRLIIQNPRFLHEGSYKCRVMDKNGDIMSSPIDLFELWLKSHELKSKDIKTLKNNGIFSKNDLETLDVSDIDGMHLSIVAEKRIQSLLKNKNTEDGVITLGKHEAVEQNSQDVGTKKQKVEGAQGIPSKRSRDDGDAGPSSDAKQPRVGDDDATPATRKLTLKDSTSTASLKKAPSSQLKQLLEQHDLTIDVISQEVSDDHIKEIYSQMENWEQVANHLSLTQPDIQAIEGRAEKDVVKMRMYTLQEWKKKNMISKEATYQVLLEALLKSSGNASAIKVCGLLAMHS